MQSQVQEETEMAPEDGYSTIAGGMMPGYVPTHVKAQSAAQQMRPLSLGEVLDRTFSVYRSRFWLFAGISVLSGAVQLVANALNLLVHHVVLSHYGFKVGLIETQIGSYVALLLFFLAATETQAATVYALSEVYLGSETTVKGSLQATIGRWYRYIGVGLWQVFSMLWLPILLGVPAGVMLIFGVRGNPALTVVGGLLLFLALTGGLAWGVVAYLRNSLGVQAAVIETLQVRPAIRRSKVLTKGTKGRIFVVLLIAGGLYWVAGIIQMPLLFFIMRSPLEEHVVAQAVILAVSFVAHTLVSPVALIGLSLVYFDQRVRHEGLDLLMLLGPEVAATVTMPVMAVAEPMRAEQESVVAMPVENVVEPMEIVREDAGRVDDGTAV
jgi:hypothetical protein